MNEHFDSRNILSDYLVTPSSDHSFFLLSVAFFEESEPVYLLSFREKFCFVKLYDFYTEF